MVSDAKLLSLPWIDVHSHFSPPRTPEESQSAYDLYHASNFLVSSPPHWDPLETINYMDSISMGMQLLSNIPPTLPKLIASNTYGSTLVLDHPTRFGLLGAIPTDNGLAALSEAKRCLDELKADGLAVTACYNGYWLTNPDLEQLWEEINTRGETVHVHPNAYDKGSMGRPAPLVDVAFETAKGVVEMLYGGMLERWPDIKWIIAHCGGAFPALSGRLSLLGTQSWVPNPSNPTLTPQKITKTLSTLYVDTAAIATPHLLYPAIETVGAGHLVYGSDCGVQCSTPETMARNREGLMRFEGMSLGEREAVGRRGWELFPRALKRWEKSQKEGKVDEGM